jgi:hypothetical protein
VAVEVRRQRQDRRRALRPHARRVRLPALRRRCRGRTATSRARRSRRRPSRRRRPATPSWARAIECDAHEYRGRIAALEPHARAAAIDDVGEERDVKPVDDGRGLHCVGEASAAQPRHGLSRHARCSSLASVSALTTDMLAPKGVTLAGHLASRAPAVRDHLLRRETGNGPDITCANRAARSIPIDSKRYLAAIRGGGRR